MWQTIVGDIMIPLDKYPHILYHDTLLQAMEKIHNGIIESRDGRKSLPRVLLVFYEDQALVGMVRRRDILAALEPKFLARKSLQARKKIFDAKSTPQFSMEDYKKILRGVMENSERQVGEITLPVQATIDYYDHIFKAVYEMNEFKLSQLPVLKDGQVVGVIRTVDVFNEIANVLLKEDYIW